MINSIENKLKQVYTSSQLITVCYALLSYSNVFNVWAKFKSHLSLLNDVSIQTLLIAYFTRSSKLTIYFKWLEILSFHSFLVAFNDL
jgi:hypothetical protein